MINKLIELCAHNKFMVFLLIGMATLWGLYSIKNITLDAIPDLQIPSDIYSRWDRSPDIMEDQVTYPIVSALLGVPKVKDIRGFSDFGFPMFISSLRMVRTSTGLALEHLNT